MKYLTKIGSLKNLSITAASTAALLFLSSCCTPQQQTYHPAQDEVFYYTETPASHYADNSDIRVTHSTTGSGPSSPACTSGG